MGSNNIKGITVEIGGDSTSLTTALKSVNKAAQKSSDELKEINRALKLDPGNTDLLAQKQKLLAEAIGSAKQKLDILKAAESSTRKQFEQGNIGEDQMRALQREVVFAENKLKKLEEQYSKVKTAVEKTGDQIEDSGDQAKDTADKVEDLGKESDKSGGKVSSFGDILKGSLAAQAISSGLRELGSAIKQVGSDALEAGSNAETAMAKVSTIADTAALPMEDLQAQIMELSTKTGKSVSEIAESVYSAISGGVDTANAVAVVEKATQLATGGFTDTATAIDVLTTAINAYGLSTDDAAKLSDYLLTTQNLGKTTVDELAGSMGKVIPLASAYGVQMDNLSSAYAIMTANGIATADSTTYIKSMLKELGDSGSTVAKTLKKATEKTFAELNAEGKSLGDVLAILGDSVDGDTGKFNELWSSSEAGIGALSILGSGTEKYAQVLGAMRDSAGTAESAYVTMTDTYEHRSEELKNTLQNLEIEGFNAFKDSVKDAMGTVNKELQSAEAKAAAQKLGKTIGSIATDLSKVAVKALPVLANALSFAAKNAGKLTVALISAKAAFKAFKLATAATSSIAGGFGMLFSVISGAIAIFSAVDAAIDTSREKLERLAKAYSEAADATLEAQRARAAAARDISDEYDGYRDLIEELDDIVDANGRVKDGYEDRAAYITGRLSEVAGVEIEITDGVIQKYGELADMLDTVLLKKQAEALLSSGQSDYQSAKNAVQSEETDEDGNYIAGSQTAYEAANAVYQAYTEFAALELEASKLQNDLLNGRLSREESSAANAQLSDINKTIREGKQSLVDKGYMSDGVLSTMTLEQAKENRDAAQVAYDANIAIIAQYEGLQNAVWAEDEGAMRDAISVFSAGLMTADGAALSSLVKQLEGQAQAYATKRTQSTEEGTTVTPAQLDASRDLLYRAFYEAYSAADAEGASTEELQRIVDILSDSSGLSPGVVSAFGEMISNGKYSTADDFVISAAKISDSQKTTLSDAQNIRRTQQVFDAIDRVTQNVDALGQAGLLGGSGQNDIPGGEARFSASLDRFQQFFADSPVFSNSAAMPLSVTNEADARVEAILSALLGVVSGMDLTLILDDGTIVAKTSGKINNALGVEVGREKRGALK